MPLLSSHFSLPLAPSLFSFFNSLISWFFFSLSSHNLPPLTFPLFLPKSIPLSLVVTILCPANIEVLADPGSTEASVSWSQPQLPGWDGPSNFTSSSNPPARFLIGTHPIHYVQWFLEQNLVFRCSFNLTVTGEFQLFKNISTKSNSYPYKATLPIHTGAF